MSDPESDQIKPIEILDELFENGGRFEFSVDELPDEEDNRRAYELKRLSQEVCAQAGYDLTKEDAYTEINSLYKNNLINRESGGDDTPSYVELAELGYEIANQRALSSRTAEIAEGQTKLVHNQTLQNHEIKYLTAILAVGTLAGIVDDILSGSYIEVLGISGRWLLVGSVLLLLVVIGIMYILDWRGLPDDPTQQN